LSITRREGGIGGLVLKGNVFVGFQTPGPLFTREYVDQNGAKGGKEQQQGENLTVPHIGEPEYPVEHDRFTSAAG
jgi:hypothetical protein